MYFLYLIPFYLKWHYTDGFKDLGRNWKNFLVFILHFFSIGLLIRTLFAPLSRLDEEYNKNFDAEAFFETLVANTLMRVVGFIMRMVVIIMGIIMLLVVLLLGPVAFVFWMIAPFAIAVVFTSGIARLFY